MTEIVATLEQRIRRAITDPESVVKRKITNGIELESLDAWQTRAVLQVLKYHQQRHVGLYWPAPRAVADAA